MQYQITYSKAKNGWIKLLPNMTLKITIPLKKSKDKNFEKILIEKWMEMLEKYKKKNIITLQTHTNDSVIIFWEHIPRSSLYTDLTLFLKQKLFATTLPILEAYSKELGIPYNNLHIKNLKTKWGSCSGINNISINLQLIHCDIKFLHYVVIHEACHLKEKNHSQNFWNLVEKYCPEYKKVRKELKCMRIG